MYVVLLFTSLLLLIILLLPLLLLLLLLLSCVFLPSSGAFFMVYVLTSALIGTSLELLRLPQLLLYAYHRLVGRERGGEGGRGGWTDRQVDRQTDRQIDMVYVKKERNNLYKFVHRFFDKKSCRTFKVCAGSAGMRNYGAFYRTRRIFMAKGAAIRQKARIVVLYKTADCGVAIKVRHFWREKSAAYAAMFSSAATARLLHSF